MSNNKYFVPSNFINSERYYQAKTTVDAGILDIETYNLKKWFADEDNVNYIINQLFTIYIKHRYKSSNPDEKDYKYFKKNVPKWMINFIRDRKIELHTESPDIIREDYMINNHEEKSFRHFIDSLSRINREFIKEYHYMSSHPKSSVSKNLEQYGIYHDSELPGLTGVPDWNPFRASCVVGIKNEFQNTLRTKTLHDMVYDVEDTRNMDIWRPERTVRMNNDYRYNNQIPVWQCSMNKRNYDRDNDGLEHSDPNRSSLETPIRGYEMTDIYKHAQTSAQYNKYGSKRRW